MNFKFKIPTKDTAPQTGPDLWPAHPSLASDESFCSMLESNIESLFTNFTSELTPQQETQRSQHTTVIRPFSSFGYIATTTRHRTPTLSLSQYRVDTLAPRASFRWREKGKTSAGYLKLTIQQKARRKNIPYLRHPVTAVMCHSKDDMLQAASLFYTSFYTPDTIEPEAVDQPFSSLSSEFCISAVSKSNLVLPFTLTDIDEAACRCTQQSSPRSDDLPYTILSVLLGIPA
ncbi:hypothetical protein G6F56_008236 [Rhizopus delemar]|nr:hypothetical protein G6F56_008236 [Rhizopus delemar]